MTAIAVARTATQATSPQPPSRAVTALTLRHWALVASPVVAGLLCTFGVFMDPGAGSTGREMYEAYGANPDPLQFKSVGLHWGYAFLALPALLVTHLVRGRGAAIANAAAVFGFLGLSTLPGMLVVDFYASAIAQAHGGADAVLAVDKEFESMWGVVALTVPGLVGTVLALFLTGLALWRAGLARWWAPVVGLLVFPAFAVFNATWPSGLLMTGFLAVFAVVLHRAARQVQRGTPGTAE